jgi:putative ABC transport system ATP-binding protein
VKANKKLKVFVTRRIEMVATLRLNSVKKEYGFNDNKLLAVNDVSFDIFEGEFTAIMGASGSGKSTLLNLIATIDVATNGCILINEHSIADIGESEMANFRRDYLGFIFQDYNLLDTLTLRENIALALVIKKTAQKDIDGMVDKIAKRLNIYDVIEKYPYQVSGGQRQRCACARAVVVEPQLILADEPTGALDSYSSKALMETFVSLNKEMGATILMVTHDAFSACYCERILFMQDGKIVHELLKNGMDNNEFLGCIVSVSTKIGEVESNVS